MIDRWAENEQRHAQSMLTSSCEADENSPLVLKQTRRNIVRPVRRFLRTVDDGGRTEDESDAGGNTPTHVAGRVSFG